ncbi:hypothetical protein AFGD_000252 [Aspergillus flavus]|nr:hypothetical protein AFGD_000252 [Aspergillus flavus]
MQGYLKGSKANVDNHIKSAAQEGSLGIKLVRGAYIEHDSQHQGRNRHFVWHDCRHVASSTTPAKAENLQFPAAALFLATHNAASKAKVITTHQEHLLKR